VFTLHRETAGELSQLLHRLPAEFQSVALGSGHLVVGPTGAFIVAAAGTSAQETADDLVRIAVGMRNELVSRMGVVPFIDALVIVNDRTHRPVAATGVPPDLLMPTLMEGPELLPEATRRRLLAAVASLLPAPAE
jgi:hypothetical protein